MSQNSDLLQYMKKHKARGITPMVALNRFGVFRLAARILELKVNHPIDGVMEHKNGKKWKRYFWVGK